MSPAAPIVADDDDDEEEEEDEDDPYVCTAFTNPSVEVSECAIEPPALSNSRTARARRDVQTG